ncbi:hypothetical protein GGR56DRAFT_290275 [Xylariaceae sp. FL0804]|nr:hypothetical protein GGR56DRAFT_290275 [Xylariaceae sp. FL0804]
MASLSSTRALPLLRAAAARRPAALGTGLGLAGLGACAAAGVAAPRRLRMDSLGAPRYSSSGRDPKSGNRGGLDPALMKQLSSGSITGFVAGLLVSIFSRTLVLLFGASVVLVQVAKKYGLDIVQQLQLKQRVGNSRILAALEKDPVYTLSFGIFFAASAFMHF